MTSTTSIPVMNRGGPVGVGAELCCAPVVTGCDCGALAGEQAPVVAIATTRANEVRRAVPLRFTAP